MSLEKHLKLAKKDLFSLCRNLKGKDTLKILKTLKIIKKQFSGLNNYNAPSKAKVFNWKVSPAWNVKDASILDKQYINLDLKNTKLINEILRKNKLISI